MTLNNICRILIIRQKVFFLGSVTSVEGIQVKELLVSNTTEKVCEGVPILLNVSSLASIFDKIIHTNFDFCDKLLKIKMS